MTRRRFKDEDVAESAWRVHRPAIVEALQRKVFEEPKQAITAVKVKADCKPARLPKVIQPGTGGRDSDRRITVQQVESEHDDEEDDPYAAASYSSPEHPLDKIKTP